MATHQLHTETNATYFVTFTCFKWLPLFEITNTYRAVYNWFEIMENKGAIILGYVIMPNHVHCLIHIKDNGQNLNKLVANGKRFLAYEIVDKLKMSGNKAILDLLVNGVSERNLTKGQKHQVFRPSFDAKYCFDEDMLVQKLDYIHANPVSGKWHLVEDYVNYEHSSAKFYETGEVGLYKIVHYMDLD